MNSIGEKLREERLRRGFTIEQIAESTKINPSLLEAIEANDLERLPGTFFTRSFVRQYAHALGIDAAELEPELDRVAAAGQVLAQEAELEREAISVPPVESGIGRSRSPRSLGALASFVLILAACSGLYILWQRSRQAPPPEPVAVQPAAPKQVPVAAPQPEAAPPVQAQPQPAPAAEQPTAPVPQATEQAATQVPPPPAQQPATLSTVAAGQPAPVRIQIRATAAVWIRLAADSKFVYSGTLQPNEARTVEAAQWIQLRTGNAAGLEVVWNGKPVGPIGSAGDVRNVEFTPSGFKVTASPAPKPAPPGDGL